MNMDIINNKLEELGEEKICKKYNYVTLRTYKQDDNFKLIVILHATAKKCHDIKEELEDTFKDYLITKRECEFKVHGFSERYICCDNDVNYYLLTITVNFNKYETYYVPMPYNNIREMWDFDFYYKVKAMLEYITVRQDKKKELMYEYGIYPIYMKEKDLPKLNDPMKSYGKCRAIKILLGEDKLGPHYGFDIHFVD